MWRTALLVTLLLVPVDAFAWRQTMTCLTEPAPAPTATPFCVGNEVPHGLRWPTNVVHYRVNERGSDDFPTADQKIDPALLAIIQRSFETWSVPNCSPFEFSYDGLSETDGFNRDDGINLVVFKDDGWPYGGSALAITSVTADLGGTIVNADMELNGTGHEFGVVEQTARQVWDVQNTVTHEAGHIVGLDHDAVADSTMEFEAQRGETKKRTLADDDIEGLCTVYGFIDEQPHNLEPDDGGCCGGGSHGATPPLWLAIAIALTAAGRRRREQE